CLQMHKSVVRLPLDDKETDEMLSNGLYEDFANSLGNIHCLNEIKMFELHQMQRLTELKNRKEKNNKNYLNNGNNKLEKDKERSLQNYWNWEENDPYKETIHMPLPDNITLVGNNICNCLCKAEIEL
ncbi:MAG TPA: hypothetical protein VE076_06110, partial [Nitrososphaeraceae archaeon]|nr:hypothetical protein [Nitrososphaeraceae archaeon]